MIIEAIKDGLTLSDEGGGGDYTPAPEGSHIARCIRVVDLGTQINDFEGQETRKREVMLTWEVYCLDESEKLLLRDNGSPFEISKRYTASLNEKANLRKHLDSWRGRPFNEDELKGWHVKNVLNSYCLLSIQHKISKKNKPYACIAGIINLPRGMAKPEPINTYMHFSLREFDRDWFAELPEYVQELIKGSCEWPAIETALASMPANENTPF